MCTKKHWGILHKDQNLSINLNEPPVSVYQRNNVSQLISSNGLQNVRFQKDGSGLSLLQVLV